jgi:hypothetical protein
VWSRLLDLVLMDPFGTQPAEPMAKSQLCLPGEIDNRLRLTLKARL